MHTLKLSITTFNILTVPQYERCFVKSYGWYENDNAIFIAMEYIEHGDLQRLLNSRPPLPESDAQQITFQVLEGLHFMHMNGYSHRDLKPGVSVLEPCRAISTLLTFRAIEYPSTVQTARSLVGQIK